MAKQSDEDERDYRRVIREMIEARGMNQKDLAQRIKRSQAWLSSMLNGHRALDPKFAPTIADGLEMSERARLSFLAKVERVEGNSAIIQSYAEDLLQGMAMNQPSENVDEEFRHLLGVWRLGAVFELAKCEHYRPEPEWVAATIRPRMDVETARQIMHVLRDHGLLDSSFEIPADPIDIGTMRKLSPGPESAAAMQYHVETLGLAQDAIRTDPADERMFIAGTMALASEDFFTFRERFEELVTHTLRMAAKDRPDRVYHVNIAVFPVSLYADTDDPDGIE